MSSPYDPLGAVPVSLGDGSPPGDDSPAHALVVRSAWKARAGVPAARPLYLSRVEAGFPSPADDYVETTLDLNETLIDNEASTFFVRVSGHSMTDVGIHDGDTLVVDRSIEPTDGDVIVAALDGELTVKRYRVRSGQPLLMPESKEHDPIPVEPGQSFVVWGVVTRSIHKIS